MGWWESQARCPMTRSDSVVEVNRMSARLAELNARLVREADQRGIGTAQGGRGTAGWLRGRLRLRPRTIRTSSPRVWCW